MTSERCYLVGDSSVDGYLVSVDRSMLIFIYLYIFPSRRTSLEVPAQQLEPYRAQRPHSTPTKHASGLALRFGLGFWVGAVAAVSRSRKQSHVGQKIPYSLMTKPYFIETAPFYAGTPTSEEIRLLGRIYAINSCSLSRGMYVIRRESTREYRAGVSSR